MDWRTIPGFMPQAIPTMQQSPYSTPPHTGGWTTTTSHASSIAFQQPTNVTLQSPQSVGYSNGFGSGAQQFKKSSMPVPGVQFGRPIHSAYPQGPMPIVHRKPNLNSSPLLPPNAHDVPNHGGPDVDNLHSMVPVKSEASDIIEVWESKGRSFHSNLGGHGPPWLQCPSRVTIKSEPVDIVEGNPWDTAKSVPAFPTNLPAVAGPDTSNWHPVSDVSSVPPPPPLSAPSHYGGGGGGLGYAQEANRISCSKKDGPPQAPTGHPLNLPYGNAPTMGGSVNHGMGTTAGVKPVPGMAAPTDSNSEMTAGDPNKMKNPNVGGMPVKCGGDMEGPGGPPPAGPDVSAAAALPKRKKEKKGPPVPCKQCGKEFSKSYMKKHIRSHAEMKPYVCPTCGKVFYSAPLLAEHESAFHDEEKKHQCYVCGHRFHQKSLLKEHLKTHVEKPYKCRVCPRSFSRRIKLNNHEKLHEGAQLKQCDICGKLLKGSFSGEHLTYA